MSPVGRGKVSGDASKTAISAPPLYPLSRRFELLRPTADQPFQGRTCARSQGTKMAEADRLEVEAREPLERRHGKARVFGHTRIGNLQLVAAKAHHIAGE